MHKHDSFNERAKNVETEEGWRGGGVRVMRRGGCGWGVGVAGARKRRRFRNYPQKPEANKPTDYLYACRALYKNPDEPVAGEKMLNTGHHSNPDPSHAEENLR